jgi:nucleoside-diphosphate-sugar epimerase
MFHLDDALGNGFSLHKYLAYGFAALSTNTLIAYTTCTKSDTSSEVTIRWSSRANAPLPKDPFISPVDADIPMVSHFIHHVPMVIDELVPYSYPKSRRGLISAAKGVIGLRLVRQPLERGWSVLVIVRLNSILSSFMAFTLVIRVNDDLPCLHRIIAALAPGNCFHLADCCAGPYADVHLSLVSTDHILFGMRLVHVLAARGEGFVFNAGAYWHNVDGVDYYPIERYATEKRAFEDVLLFYVGLVRIRGVTLNCIEASGSNGPHRKLVALLRQTAATGVLIGVSPGWQSINLVHVDDVVSACPAAAQSFRTADIEMQCRFLVASILPVHCPDLVGCGESIIGMKVLVKWRMRLYWWRWLMEPWEVTMIVRDWGPTITLVECIPVVWESLSRSAASGGGE